MTVRTSVKGSRCSSGLTLVELLVTLVIAAIVFAAMVPLFVQLGASSSRDRAYNVAAFVAQSRVEAIRGLSFSTLSASNALSNLQSASFDGGQFGPSYTPPGGTEVYTVQYSVTPVPASGAVNYLQVQVQVTTPPQISPAHTVSMATIVSNPAATSNSSSPSPSPSPSSTSSSSPSPSPSPTVTSGAYSLTVMVTNSYVNSTSGVTVVQTNVTPNVTDTPSPQFPTTSSPAVWSGLAPGTYLVTCNYYSGGKVNSGHAATLTQTVTITNANQTYTFTLN
jgi:prepilin-type N-terminal cleavage/methylation domain-containing protein